MCEWGTDRTVTVERRITVDACLADTIVALNAAGIYTSASCCGHGKAPARVAILPSAQHTARAAGYEVKRDEAGPYIELAPP